MTNVAGATTDITRALLDLLLLGVAVAARVVRAEHEAHTTILTVVFSSVAVGDAGR